MSRERRGIAENSEPRQMSEERKRIARHDWRGHRFRTASSDYLQAAADWRHGPVAYSLNSSGKKVLGGLIVVTFVMTTSGVTKF